MFTSVGGLADVTTTEFGANLVSDILIETRVQLVAEKLTAGSFDMLRVDWMRHSCCNWRVRMEHVLWSFVHTPMTVRAVSPILRTNSA